MIIKRPASKIRQGGLLLYATSLRVADLKVNDFYKIETLDAGEGVGYQRVLNEGRAKRLADYLVDAHQAREAFLPTSIFLATDKLLAFDDTTSILTIDTSAVGPFNVVDGQHRIRGLVLAAARNGDLDNFEVPVNIAVGLDEISQMCHFLIVNTTQKSVDRAIEQQIVARLTDMIDFENTPVLPKWIQRQVEKGEDQRALAIAHYLNTESGSPWRGRIVMANSSNDAGTGTINQKSFVSSLKKYILVPSNPISLQETEKLQRILKNYWTVVSELLVDDDEAVSVLFRTNGVDLFHIVSPTVFLHLANQRDFRQDTIRSVLQRGFDNLPAEFIAMSSPQFWHRGQEASGMNQAAIRKYAHALAGAINTPQTASDIAI
ncbi:MAG: DGQHR domain-containing protein [Gemmatimonadaceae bacterium]